MTTDGGKLLRMLIADDHPVVRHGLRGLIAAQRDMEVVGEAADGAAAARPGSLKSGDCPQDVSQ